MNKVYDVSEVIAGEVMKQGVTGELCEAIATILMAGYPAIKIQTYQEEPNGTLVIRISGKDKA